MANNVKSKRRKLEKEVEEQPVYAGTQKFYCYRCSNTRGVFSRLKGYFPVSHSHMYKGIGYLPWCNDCIDELYEDYKRRLGDERLAMKRMCMKLDLYWDDKTFDSVMRAAGVHSRVRSYISKLNLIKHIDKTYDHTISEELAASGANKVFVENIPNSSNEPSLVDPFLGTTDESLKRWKTFWGYGLLPDAYMELDEKFLDFVGISTQSPEVLQMPKGTLALYKQVCLLQAKITRDLAQGKSIDKDSNVLNTCLGSLNMKPVQADSDADSMFEETPFGNWIKKIEDERPISEPDEDFKDVDGIVRYITVWFLGHLCKMLGIRNTYCKLYEEELEKMRVSRPDLEEDDDEELFNDIFGSQNSTKSEEGLDEDVSKTVVAVDSDPVSSE